MSRFYRPAEVILGCECAASATDWLPGHRTGALQVRRTGGCVGACMHPLRDFHREDPFAGPHNALATSGLIIVDVNLFDIVIYIVIIND